MSRRTETDLIAKYCPKAAHLIVPDDLYSQRMPLAGLILQALWALESTETELAQVAERVRRAAEKVQAFLAWKPGDGPVYGLNSNGELQQAGVDLDRLIGVHADRVQHLQSLIHTAA